MIELPKFAKQLEQLAEPLDFWLYFLKNGAELDAEALPPEMGWAPIRKAMRVLTMLTQNALERELYEDRLKAKLDMQTLETERRIAQEQRREAEDRSEVANREREAMERDARGALIRQIRLCERLLGREPSPAEHLRARSLEQLRELAESLEQELLP